MAIAFTLLGSGTTGGSPTSGGTSTAGARFAICIAWDATASISSVVDSKGNSYSAVGTPQADSNGGLLQWYFSAGGSTGASHTATVSFTGTPFPSISFYQITDGASSAHSGSAQGQDTGGQPFVLTTGTMPAGNWGALAACSNNTGSDGAYSANASTPTFTLLHSEGTVSSFWTHGVSAATSSGAGAVTPSFSRSGTAGGTSALAILVVAESVSGDATANGVTLTATSSLIAGSAHGPQAQIDSVSTATPRYLGALTIFGSGFGASQGGSTVVIGGVDQGLASLWSDAEIQIASVDIGQTNGYGTPVNIVVTVASTPSDPFALAGFLPQSGWDYVTIGTPNSDRTLRLVSAPDLAAGDQIEFDTVGGEVQVLDDGSFVAGASVPEFAWSVWTPVDGWGTEAWARGLNRTILPWAPWSAPTG